MQDDRGRIQIPLIPAIRDPWLWMVGRGNSSSYNFVYPLAWVSRSKARNALSIELKHVVPERIRVPGICSGGSLPGLDIEEELEPIHVLCTSACVVWVLVLLTPYYVRARPCGRV
jgi:hypothetical protein